MDHPEDYVRRILKVLIYIEDHIEEDISLEDLAKVACHSSFHFHRIFHRIVGETVYQYVRRLRLERAAKRLRYSDKPITDIALDSNYDTPSAFTRAFKQALGESPRNYRELYKEVSAMTKKITELPEIKPDKIEHVSDLSLLCVRRLGKYTESAPQAWAGMQNFIHVNRLDKTKLKYFGILHDDPSVTPEDKLRYDLGILAAPGLKPEGEASLQTLAGGKYALFTHQGPYSGLDETFDRISVSWLSDNKGTFDDSRPIFLEYLNIEFSKADESKAVTKIYIPIL